MPVYEYECKECGYVMRILRPVSEMDNYSDLVCDKCDSPELIRKFSGFSIGLEKKTADTCPTGTCSLDLGG